MTVVQSSLGNSLGVVDICYSQDGRSICTAGINGDLQVRQTSGPAARTCSSCGPLKACWQWHAPDPLCANVSPSRAHVLTVTPPPADRHPCLAAVRSATRPAPTASPQLERAGDTDQGRLVPPRVRHHHSSSISVRCRVHLAHHQPRGAVPGRAAEQGAAQQKGSHSAQLCT
jgi:hypothetical protein